MTDDAAVGSAPATEPRAGLLDDVKDELQVIVELLKSFGPRDSVYYPLLYLANALVGWLVGLWLASVWADRHRRRFEAELRRPH